MSIEIKQIIKSSSNIHRPDGGPNVFLFSMPRSGSNWLMELVWSQPWFKPCNEPLDLRKPLIKQNLGINSWQDLYDQRSTLALHKYFKAFCNGRLHFMNPNPVHRYYRPLTHRIVFKVIHGGEDRINWFRDTFNGRIVLLIRHPIAVSLSREVYPRLHALLTSDYRRHLSDDQLNYALKIFDSGTKLEHGVLSWCLQNMVPLQDATHDWVIVSYEQLVQDPLPALAHLAERLGLPKPERMTKQLNTPSGVKAKSDEETQKVLEHETKKRAWLVEKWREKVGKTEESQLMDMLKRFGLDIYTGGNLLPAERFWIGPKNI